MNDISKRYILCCCAFTEDAVIAFASSSSVKDIIYIWKTSWCQVSHLYVYEDMDVNIDTIFSRFELRKIILFNLFNEFKFCIVRSTLENDLKI